eukprot:jgi/Chrzof1/207/Cz01g07050.t1
MVAHNGSIKISIGLLEKLAGIKKKQPPQQSQQLKSLQGGFGLPLLPPTLPGSLGVDRQMLINSRRMGQYLLKNETEEVRKVDQFADELMKQEYSSSRRPEPCAAEREASLQCYQENPQDVLKCSDLVDRYWACANRALSSYAAS